MSEKLIYEGRVIRLAVHDVTLPNGAETQLEIVEHPGGAAVVAVDSSGDVCLLRQYRFAVGGWLWELPAGKIDDREPPFDTAQRELAEEAGRTAHDWAPLGEFVSSPGVFGEIIHLYLARDLRVVKPNTHFDEVLEAHWIPWDEAVDMARRGEINDGKTLAGLFRAAPLLDRN